MVGKEMERGLEKEGMEMVGKEMELE